jgi:phage-related protein
MDLKELDWSMETLKGVFGSLVKKNILFYGDFIHDHNAESYYWTVPVSEERQINSVGAIYKPINSVKELLVKITDELYNPVDNAKRLFSKINTN